MYCYSGVMEIEGVYLKLLIDYVFIGTTRYMCGNPMYIAVVPILMHVINIEWDLLTQLLIVTRGSKHIDSV